MNIKNLLIVSTFIVLACLPLKSVASERENLNIKRGEQLFASICNPNLSPVSFTYNGKPYHGLAQFKLIDKKITDNPDKKNAFIN